MGKFGELVSLLKIALWYGIGIGHRQISPQDNLSCCGCPKFPKSISLSIDWSCKLELNVFKTQTIDREN